MLPLSSNMLTKNTLGVKKCEANQKQHASRITSVYMLPLSSNMLTKNTLGVKKCEANQKQHASRQVQPKALISAETKKLLYQKYFKLLA